jgi:hypothetical protein
VTPTPAPDGARVGRSTVRLTLTAARFLFAAAALAVAMIMSSCGDSDPLAGQGSCEGDTLIVGSANFPESETLANVYAETLRVNGFSVQTKLNIGSREAYIPALWNPTAPPPSPPISIATWPPPSAPIWRSARPPPARIPTPWWSPARPRTDGTCAPSPIWHRIRPR